MTKPKYLNRSQAARRLNIASATLAKRIKQGKIQVDAIDGKGKELFLESQIKEKK
jgi:predicted site-specific integrase-resolvase